LLNDARTRLEIRATTEPVRKSRLLPVLIVVLFMSTIAAYFLGKYNAEIEWQDALEAFNMLEQDHRRLIKENTQLKESLEFEKAKSQRDLQIKRRAYDEIAQTLASSSREIAGLREDIRFYESIIDSHEDKEGLQIKSVSLQAGSVMGDYQYRVIIVNSDYGKSKSKGSLVIELEGLQDGKQTTINASRGKSGRDIALLFKYFQRVDAQLTIPEGFQPQRLHVTASLTGGKAIKTEKWYSWETLLNKSGSEQG
jgi:hypothetical protein